MEEIITWINPKDLISSKNARFRIENVDLSALMESIKQLGIMQPIIARKEDKTVIAGNRRWMAAKKLGLEKVPVILKENIDEKQLMMMNLAENIQRKNISSMEIGAWCYELLHNSSFKATTREIATIVGVSESRVAICLKVFTSLPPKIRVNVTHLAASMKRKYGELPESVARAILNFNRVFKSLSKEEFYDLCDTASEKKLTGADIVLLGRLMTQGMSYKQAEKNLSLYRVARISCVFLKTEYESCLIKEESITPTALIHKIIRQKYPNLIF